MRSIPRGAVRNVIGIPTGEIIDRNLRTINDTSSRIRTRLTITTKLRPNVVDRSSSRRRFDEKADSSVSNGRESSRMQSSKYAKRYHRRREEDDYEEMSRRSRRKHSRSDDNSCGSKSRRHASKHSKEDREGREKIRRESKGRYEYSEDSPRKRRKSCETLKSEEVDESRARVRSKWDKENSEHTSSESTDSSDSDSSSTVEDKRTEKAESLWKTCTGRSI